MVSKSKTLKPHRCSHSEKQIVTGSKKFKNAEMEELKGIQEVVNQVAILEATGVMMALRGMDAGPHLAQIINLKEVQ